MTMLWPSFLYLLILIPLLIIAYIWILRQRRRFAVRYSSLALVRDALPRRSWLRQHLPFILFILALTGLIAALTRPVSIVNVPAGKATIILTIDVSRSMCSTDIKPTRIQAAEDAALAFIQRQNANTQIGLVAFSSFGEIIQPPTNDRELLDAAVKSLLVGRRTAIGSGILTALDAISEMDKNVAPSITEFSAGDRTATRAQRCICARHYCPADGWGQQYRPIAIGRRATSRGSRSTRVYDRIRHTEWIGIRKLSKQRPLWRQLWIWGRRVWGRLWRRRIWRRWFRRISNAGSTRRP